MLIDLLAHDLNIVFCGTAVGSQSAKQGNYYADPRNKFWDILHKTGLTPTKLKPTQYCVLLNYCIGLTDCVKDQSGVDRDINFEGSVVTDLENNILQYQPCILAFNGKKAAKECLGQKQVKYGLQQGLTIGKTQIFVLPSTSGAAQRYWDAKWWFDMVNWANENCPVCDRQESLESRDCLEQAKINGSGESV